MNEAFSQYVEALHPAFERLVAMRPVTIATLPKEAPLQCIYLFSEAGRFLYVGRTRRQSLAKRRGNIPLIPHSTIRLCSRSRLLVRRLDTCTQVTQPRILGRRFALTRSLRKHFCKRRGASGRWN